MSDLPCCPGCNGEGAYEDLHPLDGSSVQIPCTACDGTGMTPEGIREALRRMDAVRARCKEWASLHLLDDEYERGVRDVAVRVLALLDGEAGE